MKEEKAIRYVRNLMGESEYLPIKIEESRNDIYIEYETDGDSYFQQF